MTTSVLDTVVVGAGQAGLGTSYFLQRDRRDHVVFERGRVGETWRSQRWDSFQLNTPNLVSTLPGLPYEGGELDGFWRHDELAAYLERHVERWRLPVRTGVTVVSIERSGTIGQFLVRINGRDRALEPVRAEDTPGAVCYRVTPELYCGYARGLIGNVGTLTPELPIFP